MTKHTPQRGIVARVRAEASGDVTRVIAELNHAFKEFKETRDQKDKEIAAKFDDVVTTEKIDRINSDMGDLQAAIDQANAKLAAIATGAGNGQEIKDPEYTAAFENFIKTGDVSASLNKGTGPEGGYLAPVEWDRTITDKLIEISPMRQICRIQNISIAGFTKLFNMRGTASGWVGETEARPETATPTFQPYTYTPGEIYANPAASQGILDDAEVDLDAWLAGEVDTEFMYQEGLAFISGDGTNKPKGFLTYITGGANDGDHPLGNIEVLTAASGTELAGDELLQLVYTLPTEFQQQARWVMNRSTTGQVRLLKDGQGNYLWQPTYTAGEPARIAGYPVSEMPGMPNIGLSATPIAFGDFNQGYLIVDRMGIRVLRDPFTNKPYVHFYTTKRVGGGVLQPETLKIMQMAAA